jgi:hypothetical protein
VTAVPYAANPLARVGVNHAPLVIMNIVIP